MTAYSDGSCFTERSQSGFNHKIYLADIRRMFGVCEVTARGIMVNEIGTHYERLAGNGEYRPYVKSRDAGWYMRKNNLLVGWPKVSLYLCGLEAVQ